MQLDAKELARATADIVQAHVSPLLRRIEALETRPAPERGEKGEPGDLGAPGEMGVGMAGAMIDRSGVLILTLSNGETKDLGNVVGKDGAHGKDGADGKDGLNGADGKDGLNGVDADMEALAVDLDRRVAEAVATAVSALPPAEKGEQGDRGESGEKGEAGKDGNGVSDLLIDREGELVVTMEDGRVKNLGPVIGKDGLNGAPGKDGADGFGFDDLAFEHDGERGFKLVFEKGDQRKEFAFAIPAVIDRGVWREGAYVKGDGVTWGGSYWIAQKDTDAKPDTGDGWRLAIKKGRDGKDAK